MSLLSSQEKRIFFISDLHLGCSPTGSVPFREQKLFEFLKLVQNQASHLFLCGDIFEFWMEYRFFIPKEQFDFLHHLQSCIDSGVKVHYIAGNHDFNLGSFFSGMGVIVHSDNTSIVLQNKKLWICHGDGLAASDKKYRIIKKIIRHPLSNYLYRLLHPDWGMALAQSVGKNSRSYGMDKAQPMEEYYAAADQILGQNGADIFIMGHTHRPEIKTLKNGVYGNSGQWLFACSYLELVGGHLILKNGLEL